MSDLDVSLRRSLGLGLEVLERASRRRVDWTQVRPGVSSLDRTQRESREETRQETRQQSPAQRTQRGGVELTKTFSSLSELMCQTSLLCQKYHGSLASLSHSEQTHVCRFHGSSSARPSSTTHPRSGEDFYIEVRRALTLLPPLTPSLHGNRLTWSPTPSLHGNRLSWSPWATGERPPDLSPLTPEGPCASSIKSCGKVQDF